MDDATGTNVVVLRGRVRSQPVARDTPGGVVVQFDVGTPEGSVPVAWADPQPSALEPVVEGADVVVVGAVRRRFFRAGGATQSRTEVVPAAVLLARRHKQVQRALEEVIAVLTP